MSYTINQIEVPGVTTITGLIDKSDGLMYWATECMEKWMNENASLYAEKAVIGEGYLLQPSTFERLTKDARFKYKEVSDEAKSIGSQVHSIIEKHIKGVIDGNDLIELGIVAEMCRGTWKGGTIEEISNGYNAFLEWEKKNVVKYISSEETIFHPTELYGGTLDCIAELKDGVYVIDFKTSKAFYDEMPLQLSGYRFSKECQTEPIELKIKNRDGREFVQKVEPIKIDGMGVLRLDKETGQPDWKDYSKKYDKKLRAFLALLDYWYKEKDRRLSNNKRAEDLK